MDAQIKYRNMWGQVGLMIITFGIYSFYWFYQTAEEMKRMADDREISPALLTILLFVPFASLYSVYKHGELYERISRDNMNRWIIWLLWIFFPLAVWLIIQIELNKRATYNLPISAGNQQA